MQHVASSEPYIEFEKNVLYRYECVRVSDHSGQFGFFAGLSSLLGFKGGPSLNIDVVHTHFGPDAQFGSALASKNGVAHVISVHGFDVCYEWFRFFKLKRLRYLTYAVRRRFVLRRADIVLCCSEYVRRKAIECGVSEGRAQVHYLGVDLELIERVKGLPGSDLASRGEIYISCVGRLVPIKGQDVLIRALPIIRRKIPNVRLNIVGAGPTLPGLRRLARQLGVGEIVSFLGSRSHFESLQIMNSSRLVVVPSRRIGRVEEAFGLVAAEAMALGIPVVATDTGGLTEVLGGGRFGRLVPSDSPEDMAKQIVESLLSTDQCQIDAAQRVAKESYNAKLQVAKLENIFDNAIERYQASSQKCI
ncbi:glycosyltransferase family 4 protein [Lysobacter sp. H21R4]|nr:glycosyltransferase family 4 protein [Lysobacter sp. H21R4]